MAHPCSLPLDSQRVFDIQDKGTEHFQKMREGPGQEVGAWDPQAIRVVLGDTDGK